MLVFFFALWQLSKAQPVDITGYWTGTVAAPLSDDLLAEYTFEQEGALLKGFLILKSSNGRDSSKVKLLGSVDGQTIKFKSTEFVYRKDKSCLSESELAYENSEGIERLTGFWKGDWNLNTCPPGAKGKIELVKVRDSTSTKSLSATGAAVINPDDANGLSLVEELGRRKYYALIIGIDTYEHDEIVDLDHPVEDASKLVKVLQSDYSFQPEHTKFLKNPTRDDIINAFDSFNKLVSERDQLLIFYAGHGIWDSRLNQGYWLPTDATKESKARWLSNSTIRDYIGGIKTKHTLLITDACFSGGIFKERAVNFENSRAMLEMYKLRSRKAMTSGTLNTVPDKSVFIQYLLQKLKENTQPLLSTEDLFRTFKIAVINNSPNGQVPQYGPILQAGDEGGDFIFLRRDWE